MIRHGDCLDILREMEAESVDACVTDPPYLLGFMGRSWDTSNEQDFHKKWAREVLRVLKPGAHLLAFGGTRTYHRLVCGVEDAGFEVRDTIMWIHGSGFPKSKNIGDGRGTGLKPAHEPIVLARKPLAEKNVAANVAEWGTGAVNVDDCRIAHDEPEKRTERTVGKFAGVVYAKDTYSVSMNGGALAGPNKDGRWPANVILDEAAAAELDRQSGERRAGGSLNGGEPSTPFANCYGEMNGRRVWDSYRDHGGASRFFYIAKASRAERNAGLEGLPEHDDYGENYRLGRVNATRADRGPARIKPRANHHPTVKPLTLMRYLIRLITPPSSTALDPFAGSGTTGVAAILEGFRPVLIEREAEYVPIIEARLSWAENQQRELPLASARDEGA